MSTVESNVLGFEGIIYYGPAGATAPTTTKLDRIGDVKVPHSFSEVDASMRATGGFAITIAGLESVGVEFTMMNIKKTDGSRPADIAFIRNAIATRKPVALLVLDQVGGEGIDADFIITSDDDDQALDTKQSWNVVCKLTWAGRAPKWQKKV